MYNTILFIIVYVFVFAGSKEETKNIGVGKNLCQCTFTVYTKLLQDTQVKHEFFIKPESYVPVLKTSDWPLLLKVN